MYFAALVLAFAVLEFYGYERFGVPGTLSDFLRHVGREYPMLVYIAGFGTCLLLEHLFITGD